MWLGGTDVEQEGKYVWGHPGEVITRFFWIPGQPNNYRNQDCMNYYKDKGFFGWADDYCVESFHFMCEK